MKRLATIGLFVLSLQAAAFGNTLDFSNSGNLGSTATSSGLTAGQPFSVTDQLLSGLGTITITTQDLASCGAGCFSFTGGTVDVLSNTSQALFQGTFGKGTVNDIAGFVLLSATGNGVRSVQLTITPAGLVIGNVVVAPEPGTLSLLATGLLGLAGMLRRKLRV